MRTLLTTLVLLCFLGLGSAEAYLINGLLDDWGVQPHIQWTPTSSSASWIEEDNWGSAHPSFPSGGELYDVEAMYCDIVGSRAYLALVTSFPSFGIDGSQPGDFGIDLDRDGIYEYGLKTTGALAGGLFANPTWTTSSDFPLSSPAQIIGGTMIGKQSLIYQQSAMIENGLPTYVIEGCFDLPNQGDGTLQPFNLHWTMTCGNDMLDLAVAPVPEPATLLLLGPGFAALWAVSRKKRKPLK
jgi:hypothetical protein